MEGRKFMAKSKSNDVNSKKADSRDMDIMDDFDMDEEIMNAAMDDMELDDYEEFVDKPMEDPVLEEQFQKKLNEIYEYGKKKNVIEDTEIINFMKNADPALLNESNMTRIFNFLAKNNSSWFYITKICNRSFYYRIYVRFKIYIRIYK